jgi:hypothetical protein
MKKSMGLAVPALLAIGLYWAAIESRGFQAADSRIQIKLDVSEAEAVLSNLKIQRNGRAAEGKDWERLFATEPYQRLKKREASLKRDFSDEEFKSFVMSPDLAKKEAALRKTLAEWQKTDLAASARRVLAYLPANARLKAKVYIVIKPKTNSFVIELLKDPAIFLYLNPEISAAEFENTVAHEFHHVGLASIEAETDRLLSGLAPNVRAAVDWMGSFGEGMAMLAAAGSPEIHPHATSAAADRERWDQDIKNFNHDLKEVETFFQAIIQGRLQGDEAIRKRGYTFFGVQGPWYTVGYRMAVLVEKADGRPALIECMIDPRLLLVRYNRIAVLWNEKHPDTLTPWSAELLAAITPAHQ